MTEQYSNSFSKQFREDQEEFLNIAIKKWKFHKNFKRNLIMFSLIGIFFLVFAIIFLVFNFQIVEYNEEYHGCGEVGTLCQINFTLTQQMTPPIYVYYQLDRFYTPNRNFFQSEDVDQLKGIDRELSDLGSCGNFSTNYEMGKNFSINKTPLLPNSAACPCGEIAKMFFTDTFSITFNISGQNNTLNINQSYLAWDSDRSENFRNPTNFKNFSWYDVTDEHFMVWMRSAGLGKFKKLWGRINETIPVGQYTLNINNTYDVSSFNGLKWFKMTTSTPFGQKNLVLVGSYFAGLIICLFSILVMLVIYYRDKKKKIV